MVNKVFLIGRLGKDPVIKTFSNDGAVAEFPLATSENYKDKEGKWVEQTEWHNIKVNGKFSAERVEKYLKKGSLIHIEGRIKTRNYDDKDGNKRYITEIVADYFRMLDKRDGEGGGGGNYNSGGGSSNSGGGNVNEGPADNGPSVSDDLPF